MLRRGHDQQLLKHLQMMVVAHVCLLGHKQLLKLGQSLERKALKSIAGLFIQVAAQIAKRVIQEVAVDQNVPVKDVIKTALLTMQTVVPLLHNVYGKSYS
jgi:hypothetical protein